MINQTEKNDKYYLNLLKENIISLTETKKEDEKRLKEVQDDKPMSGDDVGSQRDDRERLEQEISNTEGLIVEAERALRWAEINGFVCAVCRKPIERDRLEADSASITCKEHRDEEDTVEI